MSVYHNIAFYKLFHTRIAAFFCRGLNYSPCGSAERCICKQNVGFCAVSEALQFTSCLAHRPGFCLDAKLRLSCQSQNTSLFPHFRKGEYHICKGCTQFKTLQPLALEQNIREMKVCARIKSMP